MSAPYIIVLFWPYLCQKLSKLVGSWQNYAKNNFDCFLGRGVCCLLLSAGFEGKHEADVPAYSWPAVQPLSQAGQVQEASVLSVLLSLCAHWTTQVPYARLEHSLRLQRLRFWGKTSDSVAGCWSPLLNLNLSGQFLFLGKVFSPKMQRFKKVKCYLAVHQAGVEPPTSRSLVRRATATLLSHSATYKAQNPLFWGHLRTGLNFWVLTVVSVENLQLSVG